MQRIFISLFIVFFLFIYKSSVAEGAKSKKVATPITSAGAQYIKSKNVVRASFVNLKGVSKISYTLIYQGNGIGQGVVGSISPGKKTSISKDLYLGSCSGKVCVKHKNIKNIQLEVKTKFTNGKSSTKVYKVK